MVMSSVGCTPPSSPLSPSTASFVKSIWTAVDALHESKDETAPAAKSPKSHASRLAGTLEPEPSTGSAAQPHMHSSPTPGLSSRPTAVSSSPPSPRYPVIESRDEAGPLPEKVGEIGYVPPNTTPTSLSRERDRPDHTAINVEARSPLGSPFSETYGSNPSTPGMAEWNSRRSGPPSRSRSRRQTGELEYHTISRLFLKPVLLVLFGLALLVITAVGFSQTQQRITNANNSRIAKAGVPPTGEDKDVGVNVEVSSNGGVSFAYIGTIFVVALLVEVWILVGSLRNLYHRLGTWVDQRYPILLPDLSDPNAITPPPPVLPWWVNALQIQPQAIRPPLLPPYAAVLNIIRTGGRISTTHGTGDAEDGEVIRTLAIGQGQAAPAFDGEEFRQSTILLAGPRKVENSANPGGHSTPPSPSSGGLMRSLSRSLTARLTGFRHSTDHSTESNPQRRGSRMSQIEPTIFLTPVTQQANAELPRSPAQIHQPHQPTISRHERELVL
ncbi:hypothetical protein CROQUDRAFT_134478 [Cronartium quercuum f. sp. fusiforme G11]|uniref:Uncharacterized protein n=1 Tax=Cronartium quercuum f. sp. fusiforme G11 TaxID=708437 RepID=A0A9P6T9J9_9BASI|nr:hypothetical protein CROQUDRAFT_134478 [Cronartium quercuum f. sp. fusiforme G11]